MAARQVRLRLTRLEAQALAFAAQEVAQVEGPPIFPWGMARREEAALRRALAKLQTAQRIAARLDA